MSIEIEIVTAGPAWPRVRPLFELANGEVGPAASIELAHPDLRVIVEVDEQPVCHVGLYRREGVWRERKTRIGGVGGLVTHPDFRHQSLASVALDAALHTLRDEKSNDFALLLSPSETAGFFTKRNWKPFMGEVYAEQNHLRARFDALQPLVYYLKRAPHEGELDLCGLPW
jgi:aminoglycoside 2'-N-acetyltransferase I